MTQTINTVFQYADDKSKTFKVYNICAEVLCVCELGKNGKPLKPSAKTIKAIEVAFWNKALQAGFIIIL